MRSGVRVAVVRSVSITPGATAFTRIFGAPR